MPDATGSANRGGCLPLLRLALACSGAAGAALWLERDGVLELHDSLGLGDGRGGSRE